MGCVVCRDALTAADEKTPKFTLRGRQFRAKCVKVYGGDTIHVVFKLNGKLTRFVCRMMLYDSAEMDSKDAELLTAATVARDALRAAILGRIVHIECGSFDKYGRLLVTVWKGKVNINQWMLDKGYGQHYRGAGKKYSLEA